MRHEPIIPESMGQIALPYSPGVRAGRVVAVSGMVGKETDGAARTLTGVDVATQTRQAIENLKAVLGAASLDLDDVFKVTVFLSNAADFKEMNSVYVEAFSEPYPARSTVIVGLVNPDFLVEIEALALDRL